MEYIRFQVLNSIGVAGCLKAGRESSLVDGLVRDDKLVECLKRIERSGETREKRPSERKKGIN